MISVIIPTFNEAENLSTLVSRVSAALTLVSPKLQSLAADSHSVGRYSNHSHAHQGSANAAVALGSAFESSFDSYFRGEILIVDDSSPDGTAERARMLGCDFPLRVLKRSGVRDLSSAVIDGMRASYGDILVVMDGDLSHPPEEIPNLLAPILRGECDMTVGSRYLPGGGCHDWPWYRLLGSRAAGLLARGVTPLTDPTSGFMAIRRSALDGCVLAPRGWKIVLECAVRSGAVIQEVPFVFADRFAGESKANLRVTLQYILHLARLYLRQIRQAFSSRSSGPSSGPSSGRLVPLSKRNERVR